MKKLRIDDLQVDSFRTSADPAGIRGTVRGQSGDYNDTCFAQNTLCGYQCGWSQLGQNCHPMTGTCNPATAEGESCNWTCNFRECNSGYDGTCDGYNCMGDTGGLQMC